MSEWQPIETAPKDGTKILLCIDRSIQVAEWVRDDWLTTWDRDSLTQFGDEPSHWMPLPPPPSHMEKT